MESRKARQWVGLDIGGANLKGSDGETRSLSRPFAIWKAPQQLAAELARLLEGWPGWEGLAVTMTAELADCFATKSDGVAAILAAVREVADGRPVQVWQTGGEFFSVEEACEFPLLVAAANWHALATWAARMTAGLPGLLIDIGSTTTDIIPLRDGGPDACGQTDVSRLQSAELTYLGVRRTPLCAVASAVKYHGVETPLAAELFATSLDLFLLSGEITEDAASTETADGRPATREAARNRLAHLLCCDRDECSLNDAVGIAGQLREVFLQRLWQSLDRVLARNATAVSTVLISGEGEFLIPDLLGRDAGLTGAEVVSLTKALGPTHSSAACAFAVSRLARERLT
ncbi:MAG: hypothetical protein KDA75_15085 [Planctomycetaceae bacterium]|nr:hypothetical protein [Planctomycetaceae bacterium]